MKKKDRIKKFSDLAKCRDGAKCTAVISVGLSAVIIYVQVGFK